MSALFRVKATFVIPRSQTRPTLFVVAGDIMEGQTIRIGIVAQLVSGANMSFSQRIYGVEIVYKGEQEREGLGLTFRSKSPEQLAQWRSIGMVGQVLTISEAASREVSQ